MKRFHEDDEWTRPYCRMLQALELGILAAVLLAFAAAAAYWSL